MNITLVKKISNVVFEDSEDRIKRFATNLANNDFKVSDAYKLAYKDVDKVRSSFLLEDISTWLYYFQAINAKKVKSQQNKEWLDSYNNIIEMFGVNPFELYVFYVQHHKEIEAPLSTVLATDALKELEALMYIWGFFSLINRDYFVNKIVERLSEVNDYVKILIDKDESLSKRYEYIKRTCRKNNICITDILFEQ